MMLDKSPMMEMTTMSSMRVKPDLLSKLLERLGKVGFMRVDIHIVPPKGYGSK
jgi:hypothetical protein